MNLIMLFSILLVSGLLLWIFLGSSDQPREKTISDKNPDKKISDKKEGKDDSTTSEILKDQKPDKENDEADKRNRRANDKIKPDTDFNLPFHKEEILPEDSPFEIYQKTFENAENYLRKGDYDTAKELYKGLKNRISDKAITNKISDNLDYIDNFKQIASKKQEERIKKEIDFPSNEIKLSMSGPDSLPDKIQIGITPPKGQPEFNMEEIVDRLKEKIEDNKLLGADSFKHEKELHDYKNSLDELKLEVNNLNELKNNLETERNKRIENDLDELKDLKSQFNDNYQNDKEVMRLQKEVDRLTNENTQLQKSHTTKTEVSNKDDEELKVRITSIQNELNSLYEQKDQTKALEEKFKELIENNDLDSNRTQNFGDVKELKQEISHLKYQMQGIGSEIEKNELKDKIVSLETSSGQEEIIELDNKFAGQGDNFEGDRPEFNQTNTLTKYGDDSNNSETFTQTPSTSPSTPTGKTEGSEISPVSSETKEENLIKNETTKEVEDMEEDFETLEEYIKGPKYNQPTDDEILGKILNDAAKEHHERLKDEDVSDTKLPEEEYEIKGPGNDSGSREFDINKLFEKSKATDDYEEEFYSKFMDRNRASRKKELPILSVTYNFEKLPEASTLSREQNVLEYSFYKYKPLIEKANSLLKRRRVKDAINYYEVVLGQDIPDRFKLMIQQNIQDLNDYLEKYMMN